MGYALHRVEGFGAPFQVVQEQIVLVPARDSLPVFNTVRKILFVLSGECRHRIVSAFRTAAIDDRRLRAGDILAVPHRCEQQYYSHEPGTAKRLHVIRLAFDPALLPPLSFDGPEDTNDDAAPPLQALAGRSLGAVRYLPRVAGDPAIQETLARLRDEARRRPPEFALRVHSLCADLTILYARRALATPGGDAATETPLPAGSPAAAYHVGRIKEYVRSQLAGASGGHAPTLREAAAHVCLSEEHAARLFRAVTGSTIGDYTRRLRIETAKTLLATTDDNLTQIVRRSGYASLTVFARNFKREESMTPSEFRQELSRQIG